jgi:hypothetical protein
MSKATLYRVVSFFPGDEHAVLSTLQQEWVEHGVANVLIRNGLAVPGNINIGPPLSSSPELFPIGEGASDVDKRMAKFTNEHKLASNGPEDEITAEELEEAPLVGVKRSRMNKTTSSLVGKFSSLAEDISTIAKEAEGLVLQLREAVEK